MSRHKVLAIIAVVGLIAMLIPLTIALAQGDSGTVTIRDSDPDDVSDKLSDQATIKFADIPVLDPSKVYEGWLVDAAGPVSTGILVPNADGDIDQTFKLGGDREGENLFENFHTFVISIEPVDDPDPAPSADKPYLHTIPNGGLAHIRHLLVSWAGNPEYSKGFYADKALPKGILVGLREQTLTAWTHADLSFTSKTLGAVQTHACHVVNIIQGTEGADYDATCGDPGDGFGVLNYADDGALHAGLAATGAPGEDLLVKHHAEVVSSANEAKGLAEDALVLALQAKNATDVFSGQISISGARTLLTIALGDAKDAYVAAQNMGTYTVSPAPTEPDVGDPYLPKFALGVLVAGAFLLLGGAYLYRRGRRAQA